MNRLLIINPGSTSTKLSVFEDNYELFTENIFHDAPELLKFSHVNDQMSFRREVLTESLRVHGLDLSDIDVFVGRGGSAHTQPSGVTVISEKLYNDTVQAVGGSEHPAKLGVMLAYELACEYGRPAFTMDPTNVDELCDLARLTGIKGVYRNAQAHVLNQKAVARTHSEKTGRRYEDCNYIICHIDGGITVHAHEKGRMIDGNVGAGGDGAFTPTRIGSVPVLSLLDYIEAHSVSEVRRMCSRSGGFVSHFGTQDSELIHEKMLSGDKDAALVWNSMIYQICKMIGEMAVVLRGRVDAILLTGGLVRFPDIVDGIRDHCSFIADIFCYPGEMEQEALAAGVNRVLSGKETPLEYSGEDVNASGL